VSCGAALEEGARRRDRDAEWLVAGSAAELERDQVVLLVVGRVLVGVAPGGELLLLERIRVARGRIVFVQPGTQTVLAIVDCFSL
jgi:hypothetical protein